MKKTILILAIVLVLTIMATLTASAIKPSEMGGYFDAFVPGDEITPTVYCIHSGENFLTGCVVQPYNPGLAEHGTFTGWVDGKYGTCEFNLRTFDLDGIARFVMNRCTGELAGFHMKGVGWAANGLWEGSYHFGP
jgi:hypothetical protein